MPALSASKQRKRRIAPHAADHYLVLLKPTIVFRALVNMASVTYSTASITFDTVTVGAYTDILPGMTVRIGSATKKSDYGTTYVRAAATSTTIPIGWSSQGHDRPGEVDLVDNAYVEVLDMREIWMETPRILEDGTIYKKYDTVFTASSPPVANIGPDYAEFVSGGAISVTFNDTPGQSAPDDFASFATAPAASIASRAWDFADGTPSSSSSTTPGAVSFPAGYRYAALTVTDTNGEEHTAYSLIVGCEASGANAPITNFQIMAHRHGIEGQTVQVKVFDELDSADYPPGTRLLIFARERFGRFTRRTGTRNNNAVITSIDTTDLYEEMPVTGDGVPYATTIASIDSSSQITLTQSVNGAGDVTLAFRTKQARLAGPTGRSQMVFSGWLTDEDNDLSWSERGLQRGLTFTAVDAAGRLAQLPGFPLDMRRKSAPTKWGEMREANIPRYLHYLLHWHSNVMSLCDFQWTGEDYTFSWLTSDGATLYDQANQRAEAMAARLGCDAFGRLMIAFDPMLQDEDDRNDVEIVDITNSDWKSLKWKFTQPPRNYWLKGAALLTSTADSDADNPYRVSARAPGFAPGQGPSAADQNYQLVRTTDEEWKREGHRYAAKLNAKNGAWGISLVHGAYCGIDPIRREWVRLRIADSNKSLRGRSFPDGLRFLPIEVNYSYDHANGIVYQELSAEEEVVGVPAVDDPPPAVTPYPYGDGGPSLWDQLPPIFSPPIVGIGDFPYTPALPMPISPLPDAPTQRGVGFGATVEGFVFKATWPNGTLTFTDRSPTSDQRASIGTCLGLRRDPRNYKKYFLYGSQGILTTNNITVSGTVTWTACVEYEATSPFDETYDFTTGQHGWSVTTNAGFSPTNLANYSSGLGFTQQASDGVAFPANRFTQVGIEISIATSPLTSITVHYTNLDKGNDADTFFENPQGIILIDGVAVSTTNNLTAGSGTFAWTGSQSGTDIRIVLDVGFRSDSVACTGTVTVWKIQVTGSDPDVENGTLIGDFQGCINRKNTYYWESVKQVTGTDYVFLNATFDNFANISSTQVAKYVAGMAHGFTVSSFNYRKLWVAAGDPADSSGALYASINAGTSFAKTAALLNEDGGAPWLNYSKANKAKNTADADLMWLKGRNGSNNFQSVKGLTGTPVTIVNSATKALMTSQGFGVIARDLDYQRVAFADGDFYVSANSGTSWGASGTPIPAGGDVYGWSQFPADPDFAFVFGDETLAFTTDAGDTWTDMSTDYLTFATGEYSGDGTVIVTFLPDLSVRYPVPIGG